MLLVFVQHLQSGEVWRRSLQIWFSVVFLLNRVGSPRQSLVKWRIVMENRGVEELAVQLEQSMDLSAMERSAKLVGRVLSTKLLNRWGVRNILTSAWKDFGEVDIRWVRENLFIISVQDGNVAARILDLVPWAVMKKNFSVKRWPPELALEEVEMEKVPFWVQLSGVPLGLGSLENVKCLTAEAGQFLELEDPKKARGFLRVRLLVNTANPLPTGYWLR